MVSRDVNHPIDLFSGTTATKGGFNTNLDKLFDEYDPQSRRGAATVGFRSDGLCTAHYLAYDKAEIAATGQSVYFKAPGQGTRRDERPHVKIHLVCPRSFCTGTSDGGAGAGLEDYWRMMSASKLVGGGFHLGAFLDEGVNNPFTGKIDVSGNEVTGRHCLPSVSRARGQLYTIKQIWSPIQILETNLPKNFDGKLTVENHFNFTDASQCKFTRQLRRFIYPNRSDSGDENRQRGRRCGFTAHSARRKR